jgi:hypothetical protein
LGPTDFSDRDTTHFGFCRHATANSRSPASQSGTTELRQGSQELSTQDAAVCQYQAIIAKKPAHLALHFLDVTDITWDVYMNGVDPAVVVETECEIKGPCTQKSVKRCIFATPANLDCSHGTGPARVCGSPVDWCSTSRDVQPTCP